MSSTNTTNGKSASRAPKSKSDYAALLDDAQLRADGLEMRRERSERELRRLLGGHENANQIMQVITRPGDGYGSTVGKLAVVTAAVQRYQRLVDANAESTETTEVPLTPTEATEPATAGK